jgi:hypothetical protein
VSKSSQSWSSSSFSRHVISSCRSRRTLLCK